MACEEPPPDFSEGERTRGFTIKPLNWGGKNGQQLE